jgi:Skp family chaperone for outer membrane proteins
MSSMRRISFLSGVVAAAVGVTTLAPSVVKEFQPPRLAVVNVNDVFEKYHKKEDVESRLKEEIREAETKFGGLEKELKEVEAELKLLQEGSPKYNENVLKRTELQLALKDMQKAVLEKFQKKQLDAINEIRDEINGEIERYAEGHELDVVLEKRITAEAKGLPPMNWPIVHFCRPEIEITSEIVNILNSQYKR